MVSESDDRPPGFEMRTYTYTVYLEVKINGSTPQERDS